MSASDITPRHTTATVAIVLLSYLMIVLDISIVITGLPTMALILVLVLIVRPHRPAVRSSPVLANSAA